jgi:riboflavin biosynthesis pyrimidine reductase
MLSVLYEAADLPGAPLPDSLRDAYGGPLGFERPCVVANFVSTIDGIVAVESVPQSNKLIAGGSDADRFVMGLLRALADTILIGAGTLRASARGLWTPERAYPPAGGAFAELRRLRGLTDRPEVAVVTGSGAVPIAHPLFEAGALVLTTNAAAERLKRELSGASTVVGLGDGSILDPARVIDALRSRGHGVVVSEAGPHTLAELLEARLVDELFLTVSPRFGGRAPEGDSLGLVEGRQFLPDAVDARLLSVRRAEGHLFLRYALAW